MSLTGHQPLICNTFSVLSLWNKSVLRLWNSLHQEYIWSGTSLWSFCNMQVIVWNPHITKLRQSWRHYQMVHYNDVIMSAMASQITSLMIVYSTVCSGADKKKHQSSAPLAFVRGIHQWPVNSLHKGPVTQKMFPFDYIIMGRQCCCSCSSTNPSAALILIQHLR